MIPRASASSMSAAKLRAVAASAAGDAQLAHVMAVFSLTIAQVHAVLFTDVRTRRRRKE